jgi:hypothetical protein
VSDEDCVLVNDCCTCDAALAVDAPGMCEMACDQPLCDEFAIDAAICVAGLCVPEKAGCDESQITCDALTPMCPPNYVPGVTEDGTCWTGGCVPINLCDVAPSCASCDEFEGWFCATDVTQLGLKPHCEPIPPGCEGEVTCACAGAFCVEPFDTCGDELEGLSCTCPVC